MTSTLSSNFKFTGPVIGHHSLELFSGRTQQNKDVKFPFSTGAANHFYSFKATTVDGKEVDFSSLKGKVVLVENVASL